MWSYTAIYCSGQISACSPTKWALHRLGWKSVRMLVSVCVHACAPGPSSTFVDSFAQALTLQWTLSIDKIKGWEGGKEWAVIVWSPCTVCLCFLLLLLSIVFPCCSFFDNPDFPDSPFLHNSPLTSQTFFKAFFVGVGGGGGFQRWNRHRCFNFESRHIYIY